MKRVSFVVVSALLVGAGFYVARNYGGDGELHLNKDGVHVEQSWLPSWIYQRRTVDYSAIIKESFQKRTRLLTTTFEQDRIRDQLHETRVLGMRSSATVRVKYHAQYPIGYVLEPGRFSIRGEGDTLVLSLERPTLISDVAVRLKSHAVLDGGVFVDEKAALLKLQQSIQPAAQQRAGEVLARPNVIPESEASLRGLLEPLLAESAVGHPAPKLRIEYR